MNPEAKIIKTLDLKSELDLTEHIRNGWQIDAATPLLGQGVQYVLIRWSEMLDTLGEEK